MGAPHREALMPGEIKRDEQRLRAVRTPLLRLHKALLDAERIGYEKQLGRIESPGAFLQLLMHDPWFAWLRPLSGLIVLIDEYLEAGAEPPQTTAAELLGQVRGFVRPAEQDAHYQKYQDLLQQHPDVVFVHREVMKIVQEEPTTLH